MSNRKAAEEYIIKYVEKMLPDGTNAKLYQDKFATMSDEEFDKFMQGLRDGSQTLHLIAPNGKKVKLETKRNLDIGAEIGVKFFQRLWTKTPDGSAWSLSNDSYLVVHLPVRRQSQHLEKKIKVAENNQSVDELTGQAVGSSKGSRVSYPELQMLLAVGLTASATEFYKTRGGDEGMMRAADASISRYGSVSQKAIAPFATGVKSTQYLYSILTSMHLRNNVNKLY